MSEDVETGGGILGNFHHRRRIEQEVRERAAVARTEPRKVEDSPIGTTRPGFFAKGRLVDEEG